MNKRQLYESIMKNIAKSVKKAINENAPFNENGKFYIICDKAEEKAVQEIIKDVQENKEIGEDLTDNDIVKYELEPIDIELSNMQGEISGDLYFNVIIDSYENWDDPMHRWIEHEIEDVLLDSYDLTFIDKNTDKEYGVFLNTKDYSSFTRFKNSNIENTEVKAKYDKMRDELRKEELIKSWKEHAAKEAEYEKNVKSNPDVYVNDAKKSLEKAEKLSDWCLAADAEKIFRILGMKEEERNAHDIRTALYHREEASAGLL